MDEEVEKTVTTMAFKANAAALALAVVGASDKFGSDSYRPIFVLPAALFLIGTIFAFLLLAVMAKHNGHFKSQETALKFRRTAMDCEFSDHQTEKMIAIAADCTRRADELDKSALSERYLSQLRRAMDWLNNLSLLAFVAGVVGTLVILSVS